MGDTQSIRSLLQTQSVKKLPTINQNLVELSSLMFLINQISLLVHYSCVLIIIITEFLHVKIMFEAGAREMFTVCQISGDWESVAASWWSTLLTTVLCSTRPTPHLNNTVWLSVVSTLTTRPIAHTIINQVLSSVSGCMDLITEYCWELHSSSCLQ